MFLNFLFIFLLSFYFFDMADDSNTKKRSSRSWTAYIPRPGSSGGRPGSSAGGTPGSAPKAKEVVSPTLTTPIEGQESASAHIATFAAASTSNAFPRATTLEPTPTERPPNPKRRSSIFSLTLPQVLDPGPTQLFSNGLERTNSTPQPAAPTLKAPDMSRTAGGSFGRMSFSSMIGGLSSLSLSRTSTRDGVSDDKEQRGRSMLKTKIRSKSNSHAPPEQDPPSRSQSRARSTSPFTLRRLRTREPSPTPQPLHLGHSDVDLSDAASSVFARTAFTDDPYSGDETVGETDAESDDSSSDDDFFDPVTERNTEQNAHIVPVGPEAALNPIDGEDPDPVGEGVNVVVAPEPYFPSSLNSLSNARGKRNPRRRKSVKTHEPLPLQTSRPIFQRDRCTITITQGDPEGSLGDRKKRKYVVASDLSEESRYAVEWGIGTVLRDGDEMLIVSVVENESKIDPAIPNAADRIGKLRSQQERQGLAYILVRQVTGLLQRTRLNVTVSCQAWHAKNSRHMLLDVVDHVEPTMLIVGSRGLGQLNGILLGSTSHYLIEKCSVPVMVARRRLKRPPKRSAHLSTHRTHVSLAEAGIDRVAGKVDEDVKVMRDELQKDDKARESGSTGKKMPEFEMREDAEDEAEDEEEISVPNGAS